MGPFLCLSKDGQGAVLLTQEAAGPFVFEWKNFRLLKNVYTLLKDGFDILSAM